MSNFPTSVDPVNVIFLTLLLCIISPTIFEEEPVTQFITPGGKPARSTICINFTGVIGLSLDGLIITVHPAAKAGGICRVSFARGECEGAIAATTATGLSHTCSLLFRIGEGTVSPYTLLPSSAYHSIKEAE